MAFEVRVDEVWPAKILGIEGTLRSRMRDGIFGYRIGGAGDSLFLDLNEGLSIDAAKHAVETLLASEAVGSTIEGPEYEVSAKGRTLSVSIPAAYRAMWMADYLNRMIGVITARIRQVSDAVPEIDMRPTGRIEVDLPGNVDVDRLRQVFASRIGLAIRLVDDDQEEWPRGNEPIPLDEELLQRDEGANAQPDPLVVHKEVLMSGDHVIDVRSERNARSGYFIVKIILDRDGREALASATRDHLRQRLAIVFEGKILVAPVVMSAITGGEFYIDGAFSSMVAERLAKRIWQGTLPSSLRMVELRPVGSEVP